MGYSRKRVGRKGNVRYTAYYEDIRGQVLSAGTFARKEEADNKWKEAEALEKQGRGLALVRGKQKFGPYVTETWFPNHRLELRGRENYDIYLNAYILDYFSPMQMNQIFPDVVRKFVTKLADEGVPASSIEYCLTILRAIFTTALNDQVVFIHPCTGVEAPARPKKIRKIITPEQFDTFYDALAVEMWQLLAEIDIETGVRWGELTEFRPKDFDFANRMATVSRVAVELMKKYSPDGSRFVVKEYPKNDEHRQVTYSGQLAEKLKAYIVERGLGEDELMFSMPATDKAPVLRAVSDPASLGLVASGSRYRHGTISAYQGAKCRCEHCKSAYALYRAERRRLGKDRRKGLSGPPRIRVVDTDGHIPRNWFRNNVWMPARNAAGLGDRVTPHSLRHAHASWVLAGGADIAVVKERLGHASILTTQKYLHTLPDPEKDIAMDAFDRIRNRAKGKGAGGSKARGA